jgi:hypothetical protein
MCSAMTLIQWTSPWAPWPPTPPDCGPEGLPPDWAPSQPNAFCKKGETKSLHFEKIQLKFLKWMKGGLERRDTRKKFVLFPFSLLFYHSRYNGASEIPQGRRSRICGPRESMYTVFDLSRPVN